MKKYFLLSALFIGTNVFAQQQQRFVSPQLGQATSAKSMAPAPTTAAAAAPTQTALEQQLAALQEENGLLNGQLSAEKLKPERLTSEKETLESDLSRLNIERQNSAEACNGDAMDPQKLRNVLGFTVVTLVEAGLGTAANVVSVVSTLKNWKAGGGDKLASKADPDGLRVDGKTRQFAKTKGGEGLGAEPGKLNLGASIAATALSVGATVTSAIAHKNLTDIQGGVASCKATFGTWY